MENEKIILSSTSILVDFLSDLFLGCFDSRQICLSSFHVGFAPSTLVLI